MGTRKSLQRQLLLASIVLVGCLMLLHTPAYSEGYVAGQFGVSIPGSLTNNEVHDTTFPTFDTRSDIALKTSLLYGAKLGYYSNTQRWFGVEAEVFNTNPHQKQQSETLCSPSLGCGTNIIPGQYIRVTTLAGNFMFRYPGKRLQPYVGIGPALFFAKLSDAFSESQPTTTVGLNTQLGLRYFMTRHVALFGEYKFNYARFNFSETANLLGFSGTYTAHNFVVGIGYHF